MSPGPTLDASRGAADRPGADPPDHPRAGGPGRRAPGAARAGGDPPPAPLGRRMTDVGGAGLVVLALGVAAFGVLVGAELAPVLSVEILTAGSCELQAEPELRDECSPSGGSRHLYSLAVLGLFAALMAWGAGVGGSRPAALGLLAAGLAVLAIVLSVDVPDLDETGQIGLQFAEAEAEPASGFYLALIGGALAVVAGVLALFRARGGAHGASKRRA